MAEVRVPEELLKDGDEAALSVWLYGDGDTVQEGALIAEISVAKTSYELIAAASGKLTILVPAGEPVTKDQVIGAII